MIQRSLQRRLAEHLFGGKVLLVMGPRQVGKTTLLLSLLQAAGQPYQHWNGDDPMVRQLLSTPNTEELRRLLGASPIHLIDEAQRIPDIGLTAKLIADQFSDRQLILSGSSSFELGAGTQEPLTGRKRTFELFPISWTEWEHHAGSLKAEQDLETRLVFGFYPDVLNHPTEPEEILHELVDSYLYKDVLTFSGIRKPAVLQKLVQALAWQVGQEVTYTEVAELVGLDHKTVSEYIDILEQAYVVFRLPAFSQNLQNEIKRRHKIFFFDNGVRNAVIEHYRPFAQRDGRERGALWENFLLSERYKRLRYERCRARMHFWRTKQQQEVDYVEVDAETIRGFEFKYNPNKTIRFPSIFTQQYGDDVKGIHRGNFREFVRADAESLPS